MKFEIPMPLQEEHEALHEQLRRATRVEGEVGSRAKILAKLMHAHFIKEDRIALPPLGRLMALARGEMTPEMSGVLELTDQLEVELPQMLAEHRAIGDALQQLSEAAERAGRDEIVEFAQALMQHARIEEEVMYPAAALVGQVVKQRQGKHLVADRK